MSKSDNDKFIQKLYNESIKKKENDEISKVKIVNQTILRAEENTKNLEKFQKISKNPKNLEKSQRI